MVKLIHKLGWSYLSFICFTKKTQSYELQVFHTVGIWQISFLYSKIKENENKAKTFRIDGFFPISSLNYLVILQVLVNLFILCTRDPGIIPRSDQPPIEEDGPSSQFRRKAVVLNGVEIKLKYCRVCKLFRPPRSCHCAVCDNCVEKFDHHCPWIGQCIGLVSTKISITSLLSFMWVLNYIWF